MHCWSEYKIKKKCHLLRITGSTKTPYIALRVQCVIEHISTWADIYNEAQDSRISESVAL